MPGRMRIIGFLALLAVLSSTEVSLAVPSSLSSLSQKTLFTDEEERDIEDYVAHWCARLTAAPESNDRWGQVERSRDRLQDPVQLCSTEFRLRYSEAVVPRLEEVIEATDAHAAANAILVLQSLGTDKALESVTEFLFPGDGPGDDKRWYVRLRAAIATGELINAPTVNPGKVNNALRALKTAAIDEENGWVLRRELEALINTKGDSAVVARERFAEAFGDVLERFKGQAKPDSAQLHAVAAVLPRVRDVYLGINDLLPRRAFGKAMAPPLLETFELALEHWDAGHGDATASAEMGEIVRASEQLLEKVIDPVVRPGQAPPQTMLQKAWTDADRSAFEADLQKWRLVVGQRAYRGG